MMKSNLKFKIMFLLFSGMFIKVLALVYKIILTRLINVDTLNIYFILTPTIMLFLGIADFSLSQSITKLVVENRTVKKSNYSLIMKGLFLGLLIDSVLVLVILIFNKTILSSIHLEGYIYPLLSTIILIPLVTVNAIAKGYFQGINKTEYGALANIIEQITRIIFSITVLIIFPMNNVYIITSLIISMIVGEIASLIFSLFNLRKHKLIDHIESSNDIKNILELSTPAVINRLIFTISNFLEPIIFTKALLKLNYHHSDIIHSFGQLSGFTMPLLLIFSFIPQAISISVMPKLTALYKEKKLENFQVLFNKSLLLCLILGVLPTILFFKFPSTILQLIYNNTDSSFLLKSMSLFFLVYYLEPMFHVVILITNRSVISLFLNTTICVTKLILIYFLSKYFGYYAYPIAIIVSIILTVLSYTFITNRDFKIYFPIKRLLVYFSLLGIYLYFINFESIILVILTSLFYLLTTFIFFKDIFKGINND